MNIGLAAAINRMQHRMSDYYGYLRGNAMGYALNIKLGFSL